MRLNCASVEEAIWNCARDGAEMTNQELAHIASCPSCKQAMTEAKTVLEGLSSLKDCPPVPDCSSSVICQIVKPNRLKLQLVWSAVCLLTIASLGAFHYLNNSDHLANKPAHIATVQPTSPMPSKRNITDTPKPAVHIVAAPRQITPRSVHLNIRHKSQHIAQAKPVRKANRTENLSKEAHNEVEQPVVSTPEPDSKVSAVSLIWSSSGIGETSYEYTEQNQSTGEVITRHTTITPNSIDVRVESTKAAPTSNSGIIDDKTAEKSLA